MTLSNATLGVINSLMGGLLTASGYTAQKYAHTRVRADPSLGPAHRHPIFLAGLALFGVGALSAVANQGLLPLVVQAPLPGLTMTYNAALARFVLDESFCRHDAISMGLIISGVALSIAFADLEDATLDLKQVVALYTRWLPLATTAFVFVLLLGLGALMRHCNRVRSPRRYVVRLMTCAVTAGLMAGCSHLFMKASVEIAISAVSDGSGDLKDPLSYVFLLAIPVSVFIQLKHVSLGLSYFDSLNFVPVYTSCIIISNFLAGAVFFDEASCFTQGLSIVFFPLGVLITIGGVLVQLDKLRSPHHKRAQAASVALDEDEDLEEALIKPGSAGEGSPAAGSPAAGES